MFVYKCVSSEEFVFSLYWLLFVYMSAVCLHVDRGYYLQMSAVNLQIGQLFIYKLVSCLFTNKYQLFIYIQMSAVYCILPTTKVLLCLEIGSFLGVCKV
jgi:hypothetical protein